MTKDLVSAVALFCLAVSYLVGGFKYGFGELSDPRPGFFPVLLGLALALNGAALFVVSLRHRGDRDRLLAAWGALHVRGSSPAIMLVAAVVVYLLVVEYLGFLLASTALMLVLMRVMGGRSWPVNLVASAATSGVLYWLFWVVMRVPIPLGRLWGW